MFLACVQDLQDGAARGFDPWQEGRDTMFVVRQRSRVHAWRDACPHYGATPMAWRKDAYLNADARRIVRSAHGALFDIESGVCTLGPCLGQHLERVPIIVTDGQKIYMVSQVRPGDNT
jgi:nitrite reductase/ring-hydroxylating ferredoxin subunit